MNVLKSILAELLALFVDDGRFVLTIITWVVGCALCLRGQFFSPVWAAVLLAVGVILLMAENVRRTARVLTSRRAE